jgi:hypothetical protein
MSQPQNPAVSPKERADALVTVIKQFFQLPIDEFHTENEKLRKAKAVAQFAVAAGELLGFINEAEIPDSKKDRLIRCFFQACLACQEDPRIFHETAERLGKRIQAYRVEHYARKPRETNISAPINDIIKECAGNVRPLKDPTPWAIAGEILDKVNSKIKARHIKLGKGKTGLRQSAVAKRLTKLGY